MEMVKSTRFNTKQLITHRFSLDALEEAYELFSSQSDGVIKVAIRP